MLRVARPLGARKRQGGRIEDDLRGDLLISPVGRNQQRPAGPHVQAHPETRIAGRAVLVRPPGVEGRTAHTSEAVDGSEHLDLRVEVAVGDPERDVVGEENSE